MASRDVLPRRLVLEDDAGDPRRGARALPGRLADQGNRPPPRHQRQLRHRASEKGRFSFAAPRQTNTLETAAAQSLLAFCLLLFGVRLYLIEAFF